MTMESYDTDFFKYRDPYYVINFSAEDVQKNIQDAKKNKIRGMN